jgi:hypothetical protein
VCKTDVPARLILEARVAMPPAAQLLKEEIHARS